MPSEQAAHPGTADESRAATQSMLALLARSQLTRAVPVACRLGVFDAIGDGARSPDELAAELGVHAGAVRRLLRVLAVLGVLARDDDRYALTALGRTMLPGPYSLAEAARFFAEPFVQHAWAALGDAVSDGQPAFRHAHDMGLFDYLATRPHELATFQGWMSRQSTLQIAAVLAAYDFSGIGTVVDVGGGQGTLLAAVLEAQPAARGILYDQPAVVARAEPVLAPVAERCQLVAGDFFASVPAGADTYLLKQVIHDWDDERALRILRNVRAVAPEDGRLIVIDAVMPDDDAYAHAFFLDLTMLVMTDGGRERTAAEHADLLSRAGFALSRIVPTASPVSVIEAAPA